MVQLVCSWILAAAALVAGIATAQTTCTCDEVRQCIQQKYNQMDATRASCERTCSQEELNGISLQQLESCQPNGNQQLQIQQQVQACLNRQQCQRGSRRGRKKRQYPFGGFGGGPPSSGLEYVLGGFQNCMRNCMEQALQNDNRYNVNNRGDLKQQQMQRFDDYQRMNWQEKWTVWWLYLYGTGPEVDMENCAFELRCNLDFTVMQQLRQLHDDCLPLPDNNAQRPKIVTRADLQESCICMRNLLRYWNKIQSE